MEHHENTHFWLPLSIDCLSHPLLTLEEESFHRMIRVWRFRVGEQINGCDGNGHTRLYELARIGKNQCEIKAIEEIKSHPLPRKIFLFQSLLTAKSMDLVIEKGSELGVTDFFPLLSERCTARLNNRATSKIMRWQTIAEQSAICTERAWFPKIHPPLKFQELQQFPTLPILFCSSDPLPQGELSKFRGKEIGLCIGPEGGFSPREAELAIQFGLIPFTLGEHKLRAETAAIAILGILTHLPRS
ncbi:MAG: 16S rRNA (uracil(1498)-N(3))-methyltransferase [Deltaproteobacteria bacterium]|nr:16S rRNA (uracil(1498)-N(3))-methyltransferase [Deltaproteobacteria bacterium]